jgi:two-component system, NarL family, sensor kinase
MVAGWSVFALACVLVAAGAVMRGNAPAVFGEDAVLAIGFTGLGALVLSRQPFNRAGWLCLAPVLAAVAYAAQAYSGLAIERGLRGGSWASWLAGWLWLPGLLPVLTVLLLVLPHGRLPGPRWRPVAWLVGVVISVLSLLVALIPAGPGRPAGPGEVPALAPVCGRTSS